MKWQHYTEKGLEPKERIGCRLVPPYRVLHAKHSCFHDRPYWVLGLGNTIKASLRFCDPVSFAYSATYLTRDVAPANLGLCQ